MVKEVVMVRIEEMVAGEVRFELDLQICRFYGGEGW
jgi:hypothetical protein